MGMGVTTAKMDSSPERLERWSMTPLSIERGKRHRSVSTVVVAKSLGRRGYRTQPRVSTLIFADILEERRILGKHCLGHPQRITGRLPGRQIVYNDQGWAEFCSPFDFGAAIDVCRNGVRMIAVLPGPPSAEEMPATFSIPVEI
jgi:hypothetical protein